MCITIIITIFIIIAIIFIIIHTWLFRNSPITIPTLLTHQLLLLLLSTPYMDSGSSFHLFSNSWQRDEITKCVNKEIGRQANKQLSRQTTGILELKTEFPG
jgi:hypothetical protein